MRDGRSWVGLRRGILLVAIVVGFVAVGHAGTLIARADPPVDSAGPPSIGSVQDGAPLEPDVTIAITNAPEGEVVPGDSISYTLDVSNQGPATATAVGVSNQLPAGVTFTGATAGCAEASGLVTCALGDVGAGVTVEIEIAVTVEGPSCGAIVDAADVSASNESGDAVSNNAANEVINTLDCEEPTRPNLRVSKSSDADGILHGGDDFLYTITVTNVGEEEATGVELLDMLPSGALHVAVPPFPTFAGGACTVTSSVPPGGAPHAEIRCGPVSLAPGESATVTFKVIVNGDVCGSITNVVDVEGANEPAVNVGRDNHADASDRVACMPRIRLWKGGPSLAHVSDTITYVFAARNDGRVDLSSIDLTDPTCGGSVALVANGDGDDVLAVGEGWRFRCEHTVTAGDGDPVHSRATVTGDHRDGTVTASDTHEVNVIHPSIDLEKNASPTSGPAGTLVVYTYAVTNTGDTTLFDVSVEDGTVGRVGEITTLTAGQTVRLTHEITLGSSPIRSMATAEGSDVLGASVRDVDDATVSVVAGGGGGGGGGSPFTGSGADVLARWAAALAALGAALLLMSRKRSQTSG